MLRHVASRCGTPVVVSTPPGRPVCLVSAYLEKSSGGGASSSAFCDTPDGRGASGRRTESCALAWLGTKASEIAKVDINKNFSKVPIRNVGCRFVGVCPLMTPVKLSAKRNGHIVADAERRNQRVVSGRNRAHAIRRQNST